MRANRRTYEEKCEFVSDSRICISEQNIFLGCFAMVPEVLLFASKEMLRQSDIYKEKCSKPPQVLALWSDV